jgi:acyl-CoA dehydrogenase
MQQLSRLSAGFALLADVAMGTLGGSLKRKENITGRLADALAWQYLASAAVKRFVGSKDAERDRPAFAWALEHALFQIERALVGTLDNLPNRPAAFVVRWLVFPFGARRKPPSDRLAARLARAILEGGALREALSTAIYVPERTDAGLGKLEAALAAVTAAAPVREKLRAGQKARKLARGPLSEVLEAAVRAQFISESEKKLVLEAEAAREAAIAVDAFGDVREPSHAL